MAQIQPVENIWKDGQRKIAEVINLRITFDNLSTEAHFAYELAEATINDPETLEATFGNVVSSGFLTMDTQDYIDWDNSNESAYQWAASKLNLVLI